jgi:hypothetical protein
MALYLPTGLQSGSGSRLVGFSLQTRLSQGEKQSAMMTQGIMRFQSRARRLVASASMPAVGVGTEAGRVPHQHGEDHQRKRDDTLSGYFNAIPHSSTEAQA